MATLLKKTTQSATELKIATEKCTLYAGTYIPIQEAARSAQGNHYIVNTRHIIAGCEFSKGYVFRPHVAATSTGGGSSVGVYQPLADRIRQRAVNQALGYSVGQCWKYANDAVTGRGGVRMGMYAMEFFRNNSDNQMKNQFGLCKMFKANGNLETSIAAAPVGSVIGYAPGLHGFDSTWGHGEVKVSSNRYCSDFCTNRSDLRASFILIPCTKGAYNQL